MKDKELREALESIDIIGSADDPTSSAQYRKDRFKSLADQHSAALNYTFKVDCKLDALLKHLGLEYIARPQPIIQKIKKGKND